MCGIAGIRRYGNQLIEEHMIRMFLTGLEHRGNDATGIAMQRRDGHLHMLKMDIPAWRFVSHEMYKDFIAEHLNDDIIQVTLHTRAATKGNPREPKNNHPLYFDKGMVVHNGMIHNDDELFRTMDIKRRAETDTDVIRGIIDKYGLTEEAVFALNKMRGSAAIACMHPAFPGQMLLAKSGSPLQLGSTDDFFVFASEKHTIHRAMRPFVERHGTLFQIQTPDMAFSPFPEDTAWLMGDHGKFFHGAFRTIMGTYREPIRRIYNGWEERQRKWNEDESKRQEETARRLSELEASKLKEGDKRPADHFNPTGFNPTLRHVPLSAYVDSEESKKAAVVKLKVECPHCHRALSLRPDQQNVPRWALLCPTSKGGCGKKLADKPKESDALIVH